MILRLFHHELMAPSGKKQCAIKNFYEPVALTYPVSIYDLALFYPTGYPGLHWVNAEKLTFIIY